MPGYHGTKVSFQPEFHMMHKARSREVLYPRQFPMGKMGPMNANPALHPMFDAVRTRHAHDKADYARMMKSRDYKRMGGDGGYPTFDSLKLLGAENDASYLDVFMSENAKHHLQQQQQQQQQHHHHHRDDNDMRPRARSCSQTSKSNSSKRNSLSTDNMKKTILGSLRSAGSDDNIYESVEVIQYRKTIEAIKRHNKMRTVAKTGHPLFDHLRVEKVLKPDRHARQSSDGGSNSQSSSGSSDEFDYTKKPNCRFSRREVLMTSREQPKKHHHHHHKESHHHRNTARDSHQNNEEGSESDDDWTIPRPKFGGGAEGGGRSRRTGATGLTTTTGPHEESDSSSKSTGLR